MAKVDLSSTTEVSPPEVSVTELKGLPLAGVKLSKWLLVIISGFVVLLMIWIGVAEFHYSHWLHKMHFTLDEKMMSAISAEQKNVREFCREICQMVLLNFLLPILTAVLGYTFGSRASEGNAPRQG